MEEEEAVLKSKEAWHSPHDQENPQATILICQVLLFSDETSPWEPIAKDALKRSPSTKKAYRLMCQQQEASFCEDKTWKWWAFQEEK